MDKAKKKLTKFDFSGANAHVALVHREQNGAANMYKTLITKATDVKLELSMEEFLRRFFDMWWDDAEFLAKLLGYEVESDSYESEQCEWKHPLEDKVTVMKKAKESGLMSLDGKDKEILAEAVQKLSSFSNVTIKDIDKYAAKDAGGDNPVSDIEKGNVADKTLPDNQENTMSEMIEKSAVEALIQKALEEKQAEIEKAVAEKESKIEELTKSLQAFEAEKAEAKKAEFVAKAADFEVLGVEDKESFGVALMKMSEQEELAGVMSVLEKAVQIAKGVEGLGEVGHDLEPEEEQISGVMKAVKARKTSK
jgi:hypothetical protein